MKFVSAFSSITILVALLIAAFVAFTSAVPYNDVRADHPDAKRTDVTKKDHQPRGVPYENQYEGQQFSACLFGNLINGDCVCASGCISARRVCDDPFGGCSTGAKAAVQAFGGLAVAAGVAVALL